MTRRYWTPAEVSTLRARYTDEATWKIAEAIGRAPRDVYAKASALGLHKSDAFLASPASGRLRHSDTRGEPTRFRPGHMPWNKGTSYVAGGRSHETRFKKGHVSTRWDPEVYVIGALRINSDGGLDIKITNGTRGWVSMARWTWEAERGPIPVGKCVRAINGDRHDTRIENLRLSTKREVMLENTLHNYPKPLTRAIQLRGALNRRINRIVRKQDGKHAR
jgi:hypothetical protein